MRRTTTEQPWRRAALDPRRRLAGWGLATAGPAALTLFLASTRDLYGPPTELILFLALAVAVALVGGLGPAVCSAVVGSLLANYWFTPPYFTWTVADPQDVLALIVFVVVAVAVSSVVDLAARRGASAASSRRESEALSELARGVLHGEDTTRAVLSQLCATFGVADAELWERRPTAPERSQPEEGRGWRCVSASGAPPGPGPGERLVVRIDDDRCLRIRGVVSERDRRVLDAFAAQTAVVAERERLREEAARAHRLEQGVAIRTALLAAVSHDLRTPLATIKAGVTSLRQDDAVWEPGDEAELLAVVEESADQLQRLIDNLLDLTRLQTGVVRPLVEPVGLDEVVPVSLTGLPEDSVDLDVPESLPRVLADAGLLERVVANVVQNAVTYAGGGARGGVRVVAHDEGSFVVLCVVDHGPGVPAAVREEMFRPFQRLGDAPSSAGVGLGLAVARGFVEAMDGTLVAAQTPGGGLTMLLRLPVADPTSPGDREALPTSAATGRTGA